LESLANHLIIMWSLLASPSLVVHPVSPHALPAQPPAHVVRTPLQQPELPSSLVAGLFGLGEPKPDGKNVFKVRLSAHTGP